MVFSIVIREVIFEFCSALGLQLMRTEANSGSVLLALLLLPLVADNVDDDTDPNTGRRPPQDSWVVVVLPLLQPLVV